MGGNLDGILDKVEPLVRTGEWEAAFDLMAHADAAGGRLSGAALQKFATCAYMTGREEIYVDLMSRAFEAFMAADAALPAARAAFWIGLTLVFRGEGGRGGGWLARAQKLVSDHGHDCAEAGYVLLPGVEANFAKGDNAGAMALATQALAIGERFDDDDLMAIARHLLGRARLSLGDIAGGIAALDETMVAVTEGNLSPIVTGLIYCSVIEACQRFQILRRASEWTGALSSWCARQPDLVAFTGRCLIHRSEVLLFEGQWPKAEAEAGSAIQRLSVGPAAHHAGPAFYQLGELHRLRGDMDAADASFRSASALGFDPQPGLALMRLHQGNLRAADNSIRRALAAADRPEKRIRLLPAAFEIALASESRELAEEYCAEMTNLARAYSSDATDAAAAEMRGDLNRAFGEAGLSLSFYSLAAELWREMSALYSLYRVRLRMARSCLSMGDTETAATEARMALDGFERLGAEPDRKAAEALLLQIEGRPSDTLTRRQREVLRLIAEGLTNREIALKLKLSERTIDRHVSDILTRIDVPTRSAAVAFALTNGLLRNIGPG